MNRVQKCLKSEKKEESIERTEIVQLLDINKKGLFFNSPFFNILNPFKKLSYRHFSIKVHILNRIDQFYSHFHIFLEGFST